MKGITRLLLLFLVSSLLISCKSQSVSSSIEEVPSSVSEDGVSASSSSSSIPTSASFVAPVNKTKLERPQRVVEVAVVSAPVHASLTGIVE